VISVVVGLLFFSSQNVPSQLGSSSVLRAMLVNLMVYALWAVFGIGFGALIRGQIGATVTAALLYTVGSGAVEIILALLRRYVWHTDHIYQLAVLIPGVAASVAVSPVAVEINDSARILWWVGVIVMLGYGILFGVIGTTILRKRDIS
jgi:ABC-2 type transport system permease protein